MKSRTLRVVIIALALVLVLGATQAAVAPQAKETKGQTTKAGHRTHFHGFIAGAMNFFRLAQWMVPGPTPPVFVPPTAPPETTLLLGAPQDLVETTARPITDDQNPI